MEMHNHKEVQVQKINLHAGHNTGLIQTSESGWFSLSAVDHNNSPILKLQNLCRNVDQQDGWRAAYTLNA